jgi:hypothetical protein
MPLPPPPPAALSISGYPMRFAASRAAATSPGASAVPSTIGTPASRAIFRARVFSPRRRCTLAGGPTNVRPALVTASAKSAFSDRKP